MKITQSSTGVKVKISESEWKDIGIKQGWIKSAQLTPPTDQQIMDAIENSESSVYHLIELLHWKGSVSKNPQNLQFNERLKQAHDQLTAVTRDMRTYHSKTLKQKQKGQPQQFKKQRGYDPTKGMSQDEIFEYYEGGSPDYIR